MRAKRAKIFGVFFADINGDTSKNNQKYVLYTRIVELEIFDNIKRSFWRIENFWKILKDHFENSEIFSLRGGLILSPW